MEMKKAAEQAKAINETADVTPAAPQDSAGPSLAIDKAAVVARSPPKGATALAQKQATLDPLADWFNCSVPGVVCARHPVDPRSLFVTANPKVDWYADMHVRFLVRVPAAFPKQAPIAHCITPVFHPNISSRGNLGWNIVENWRPEMGSAEFFGLLLKFLTEPQPEFANNKEAAAVFPEQDKFIVAVKAWRSANGLALSSSSSSSPSNSSPLSTTEIEAAFGALALNGRR